MRIGINALYLIPGGVGGTEIYLTSLMRELHEMATCHQFFIYTNRETPPELFPEANGFQIVPTGVNARFRPARILYEQIMLPHRLKRDAIDVLLNPGFTGPASFGSQSVSVFHDLQHKRHPENFRWFDLPFWNLLLSSSARKSRSLIAVSEPTASDLLKYYPDCREKVVIIPHGVDPEFFRISARRSARRAEKPFLLTVSTLHPHKNLLRLLEAFQAFRERCPHFELVIAGLKGFASAELVDRRKKLGLEESVRFTGWVPRQELYELYADAHAFVAPSEFEGFGMPLTEALAAGIPSACSAIPPLLAIAGDVAARFAPDSIRQMTEAMHTITSDEGFRARAILDGPALARRFDWSKSARLTLDALERVGRVHRSR